MVIDDVKRLRWEHLHHSIEPAKLVIGRKAFNKLEKECYRNLLISVDAGDHADSMIFNMLIEVRDDIEPDLMFIIS